MDLTLPITGGSLVLVVAGYLAKQGAAIVILKAKRWDKHLEECQTKAIDHGRLEEKVHALGEKVDLRFDAVAEKFETIGSQMDRIETKLDRKRFKNRTPTQTA